MCCSHEEQVPVFAFHVRYICEAEECENIIVRSCDTDVLIMLLANAIHFQDAQIWLEVGLTGNNTHRFIDITQLAHQHGDKVCKALSAFHAFTGCDFTASFCRREKIRPFKIMEKNPAFIEAFGELGQQMDISDKLVRE